MKKLIVLSFALALGACASQIKHYGLEPDVSFLEKIEQDGGTRSQVRDAMGPPSIVSLDGKRLWVYIWRVVRKGAFLPQFERERSVIAIRFGAGDEIEQVERFGQEDGIEIAHLRESTAVVGEEKGWLERLFGNIGRVIPAGLPSE